jgi:hypothetical protein
VLAGEGSIIDQSLVLEDTGSKGYIIILTPSTEGMKQEDWVLVTLLDQLLASVFEEKNVSIMKGVANLEGVNCISTPSFNEFTDFSWSVSVFVHAIAKDHAFGEVHA